MIERRGQCVCEISLNESPELIAQELQVNTGIGLTITGLNESPELIAQESAGPVKDVQWDGSLNESPELIAQELHCLVCQIFGFSASMKVLSLLLRNSVFLR